MEGGEEGSVHSDAKRQSEDSDRREAWALAKHAHGVSNVAQDGVYLRKAAVLPIGFLHFCNAPKANPRFTIGLVASHAAAHVLFREQSQVSFNFLVEVLIQPASRKKRANSRSGNNQPGLDG